jgi:processive 1,2-diacylglycerol beta-glucosyltransferase/1,2-diacylglycerol 3-beta-galactosyltransferase
MIKTKKKYLLLYLNTGGGHLAPAKSIANCIDKLSANSIEPILIDGFEKANKTIQYVVEDGYRKLQSEGKWFYQFLYSLYYIPIVTFINDMILESSIIPNLEKKILEEKPEKIIIFHFFLIRPVYRIIKKHRLKVSVFTVVTDPFTAHPFWFINKKQNFILFSERLKKHALKVNLPEVNLHVFPFILDEKYSSPIPAQNIPALKKKYGFEPAKKMVLIFGGGDGIPNGKRILELLLNAHIDLSIGIVGGKDEDLFNYAEEQKKQYKAPNVQVFGYVDFIYDLLNISDFVITKAGASATMEILLLKKIPIIIDYIWGQEKGNMEYIRDNKMGIFERDIKKIPSILNELLNNKEKQQSFINNIESEKLKIGTEEVTKFILSDNVC